MALVKNGLAALPEKQSFKLAVVCACALFRLASNIFCHFFRQCRSQFRCGDTWSVTKKSNINNQHFLKSSPKAIVYCCQYFVNDLTMMWRFYSNLARFLLLSMGGAALTQLNFLLCYVYLGA